MFKDKVCLITGAVGGIGMIAAEEFAKSGAKVVMTDMNEKLLKEKAEEYGADYIVADMSIRESNQKVLDFAFEKHGRVDILLNLAGFQLVSPIEEFPMEMWDKMLEVMLTSPYVLIKGVWESMKENGWGRIVNLNSIHGLIASEFKSGYISTKHGLSGLTKAAAMEGGKHGITVNSICSSYADTPIVANQVADQAKTHGISENEVLETIMLEKAAIKKLVDPKDIAEFIKFLCSDAAKAITGTLLPIDAGWTAN